jgi:hypothetical protein
MRLYIHSIFFLTLQYLANSSKVVVFLLYRKLKDKFIPEYIASNETNKSQNAEKIFDAVCRLRAIDFLSNNPINLKQVDSLKNENTRLREENRQLKENVTDLTSKLMTLIVPKDEKVGVT